MITAFPSADQNVQALIKEHQKLRDEPLLFAVYYAPDREPQDIFLFEIFEGFGNNGVDPEGKIFEVAYGARSTFPLSAGQKLRLVVTNPVEFETAVKGGWEHIRELRAAIAKGNYQVVFEDAARGEFRRQLGV